MSLVLKFNTAKGYTSPESGTVGYPNGEVGKYSIQPICQGRFEGQIMGDFVDRQEKVLVCRCTNDISCYTKS